MADIGLLTQQKDSSVEGSTAPDQEGERVEALPPVDTGWSAWSFLAGTWIVEALFWGEINRHNIQPQPMRLSCM